MTDMNRQQLEAEATHWRLAIDGLADLEAVAAPAAWDSIEQYLQLKVRSRLAEVARSLQAESLAVARMFQAGRGEQEIRQAVLALRSRYLRAETLVDFYGDAVNSRTNPWLAELLQGYDVIAVESMATVLDRLGLPTPPVLVYVDKGLGAAILRAGIRLWDAGHPSPAAAIKLTRHNLSFPTALLHETGHQVNALTGFNDELAVALREVLAPRSVDLADLWASWSCEIGADVHAFLHAGWAPVVALANVVDGDTRSVFRIRPGDPHPFPWIRVLFNVALCRQWYGPGPWDQVGEAWLSRHDLRQAGEAGAIALASVDALNEIVEVCTRRPMRAFRGQGFADLVDPCRVAPPALRELERTAGETLLTSSYLRRREQIRILAALATRIATDLDADRAETQRTRLTDWVRTVGRETNRNRPRPKAAA